MATRDELIDIAKQIDDLTTNLDYEETQSVFRMAQGMGMRSNKARQNRPTKPEEPTTESAV